MRRDAHALVMRGLDISMQASEKRRGVLDEPCELHVVETQRLLPRLQRIVLIAAAADHELKARRQRRLAALEQRDRHQQIVVTIVDMQATEAADAQPCAARGCRLHNIIPCAAERPPPESRRLHAEFTNTEVNDALRVRTPQTGTPPRDPPHPPGDPA